MKISERPFAPAALLAAALAGIPAPALSAEVRPACALRSPVQRPLEYPSVEVERDGRVTFRLCAPNAAAVRLGSTDIDGVPAGYDGKPAGLPMRRDSQGYWSATTAGPVAPGSYRYAFEVDGAPMPDPQGTRFSQRERGVASLLEIPGGSADFHHAQAGIPHGVVSVVDYPSASLGMPRRAHVYTPPGYEGVDSKRYPVLYLVHGAGDSDDSWTSIGQAQHILDRLIAAGQAQPMIVVMPFGHTPDRPGVDRMNNADFGRDLHTDLIPYVDRHFRTLAAPATRAMAGLSMGGAHTLNFGLPYPELFGAIGIFSIGIPAGDASAAYRARNGEGLHRRAQAGSLVFYAFGKDDFLYPLMAAPTRQLLADSHIPYTWRETGGGHDWVNWRGYLAVFAPQLFR